MYCFFYCFFLIIFFFLSVLVKVITFPANPSDTEKSTVSYQITETGVNLRKRAGSGKALRAHSHSLSKTFG